MAQLRKNVTCRQYHVQNGSVVICDECRDFDASTQCLQCNLLRQSLEDSAPAASVVNEFHVENKDVPCFINNGFIKCNVDESNKESKNDDIIDDAVDDVDDGRQLQEDLNRILDYTQCHWVVVSKMNEKADKEYHEDEAYFFCCQLRTVLESMSHKDRIELFENEERGAEFESFYLTYCDYEARIDKPIPYSKDKLVKQYYNKLTAEQKEETTIEDIVNEGKSQ